MKQCKSCPWKVSASTAEIPGYDRAKHEKLRPITNRGETPVFPTGRGVEVMACHLSREGADVPCAGWLSHQLGPGNNIPLRLMVRRRPEWFPLELDGEQREDFEETFAE